MGAANAVRCPRQTLREIEVANNVLLIGVLGTAGWLVVNGPPPVQPAQLSPAPQGAVRDSSSRLYVQASHSPPLERRQDPVPLVRHVSAPPVAASAPDAVAALAEDRRPQDDPDLKAATLAAERDGYRRVSIVGRAGNGAWRAKAYRGATEVLLTVDGTGRVSLD
jgi:hypothetical protein